MAHHRSRREPAERRHRRVGQPRRHLLRRRFGRHLEERRPRRHLGAGLRRSGSGLDQRAGGLSFAPRPRLGGHRGDLHHSAGARDGERDLPLHRWRALFRTPGPRGHRAYRPHPGPPGGPGSGLCLCPRPLLRAPAGAGRLSHPGRRSQLGAGPPRGREHRLLRSRHGPPPPRPAARGDVATPDQHRRASKRRPWKRHLPLPGRRRHLGAALRREIGRERNCRRGSAIPWRGPGTSRRRGSPHREGGGRNRPERPRSLVRPDRGSESRVLPLRRRR